MKRWPWWTSLGGKLAFTPPTPAAELADGTLGKVVGVVRALAEVFEAPLTGRACVYYLTNVHRSPLLGNPWQEIVREEAGVPFALVDASGRAIVEPRGAELSLAEAALEDPRRAHALLARHGVAFDSLLRFSEAVISPGGALAVYGGGVREADPDAVARAETDYRHGPHTSIRLASSPAHPLLITDDVGLFS